MNIKFCSIETGKVLLEWVNVNFTPSQGDAVFIDSSNIPYSVISRVWIDKDKVCVNVEKIPRG